MSKQKITDCKTDRHSLFSPSDCALLRLVNAIMLLGLELSSLLVAVCTFLLAWYFFLCADTRDRFPPGPWKFPLLGNLPQIMWYGDIMKFCKAYRRKYGNVSYSFKLKFDYMWCVKPNLYIVKVPSKSLSVNESCDGRMADGKAYMYLIYDLCF